MSDSTSQPNPDAILQHLRSLDARISRLESILHLQPAADEEIDRAASKEKAEERSNRLEFQIGQYWLAKTGIIVIAIGIVLLLTFPYQSLPPIVPSAFGYLLVLAICALSYYWRNTYAFISRYLLGGALLLLYFTTLRLTYFSLQPAVTNRSAEVALLVLVVLVNLYISVRVRSAYIAGLTIVLGYATAILADQTYALLAGAAILSGVTVYISGRYQWRHLVFVGIILSYLTHLIWFVNNPLLGNKIQFVLSHHFNVLFLLLYALIFAGANFFRKKDIPEDNLVLISTFLNSVGAYGLFLLITYIQASAWIGVFHFGASVFFLILSILFWIKEKSKYSTFFFSIFGYMALSAAIILQFRFSDAAIWLCVQSLLVISTAIWFRSKFIVVANFGMYIIVLIAYLIVVKNMSWLGMSYGIVALLSARIMNWQKDRLELNTEMMRNAFLLFALLFFPYAFWRLLPAGYVGISWMGIAIAFYMMGRIVRSNKYRWMALATLLLTLFYVFIIAIIKFEPVYRIISFLGLGLVLIVLSIVYFRMSRRNSPDKSAPDS